MDQQKKPNKIREIVRLQQILKKWRRIANASNINNSTTTIKSIKFLKRTFSMSENEGRSINRPPIPKGYLAVCVGVDLNRFIIPTEYLCHQAFQILLREAEEEFGFEQTGVLRIPCEVSVFESILKMVEKKTSFSTQKCSLGIEKMMGYCSFNHLGYHHHPQIPMCR